MTHDRTTACSKLEIKQYSWTHKRGSDVSSARRGYTAFAGALQKCSRLALCAYGESRLGLQTSKQSGSLQVTTHCQDIVKQGSSRSAVGNMHRTQGALHDSARCTSRKAHTSLLVVPCQRANSRAHHRPRVSVKAAAPSVTHQSSVIPSLQRRSQAAKLKAERMRVISLISANVEADVSALCSYILLMRTFRVLSCWARMQLRLACSQFLTSCCAGSCTGLRDYRWPQRYGDPPFLWPTQ